MPTTLRSLALRFALLLALVSLASCASWHSWRSVNPPWGEPTFRDANAARLTLVDGTVVELHSPHFEPGMDVDSISGTCAARPGAAPETRTIALDQVTQVETPKVDSDRIAGTFAVVAALVFVFVVVVVVVIVSLATNGLTFYT